MATAFANLATALPATASPDSALTLLNRALGIRASVFGEVSADVANTLMTIGNHYSGNQDATESVSYYERAISIYDSVLPPNHRATYFPYYNIGVTLNRLDRFPEAQRYLERAVEIAEVVLGSNHPSTAITLHALGNVERNLGDTTAGMDLYKDAVERFALGAPDHPWVAYPVESMIGTYRKRAAWTEVDSLGSMYWSSIASLYAEDPEERASLLEIRAQAARELGRAAQADSLEGAARTLSGGR